MRLAIKTVGLVLLALWMGAYPVGAESLPPVQEIDLAKAERVVRVIPAEESGITYQCFDVTDYEMARPTLDENGDIAFASYTYDSEVTAHLLDWKENKLRSFPTMYQNASISDIYASNEALYWIEFVEYPDDAWALVRQPLDGSKPQIVRENKNPPDTELPLLYSDGHYMVWAQSPLSAEDNSNEVMALSTEDGQIKTIGQSLDTRIQTNNGYAAYLAKVDGDVEIHVSDVKTSEKVRRYKVNQFTPDRVSYDGGHLVFIVPEEDAMATGKQYIWDGETLRILGEDSAGWKHEMSDGRVLCMPSMAMDGPFVYDIANDAIIKLPAVSHDGKGIELFLGSIREDTLSFVGTYEEPDPDGPNEVLVVMTLPSR